MNEESKSGMSWLGVLFVILVVWAIFGGGFGNWGNRGYNADNGCNRVSNCQVERQEIIDSARTQYLIEQQGATTRNAVRDTQDALAEQLRRQYDANQAEKIFDLKMENQSLKSERFSQGLIGGLEKQISDMYCAMGRRLDSIECDMLKRPQLSGVAVTSNGQLVPAIWGNNWNNCWNNGSNRNI